MYWQANERFTKHLIFALIVILFIFTFHPVGLVLLIIFIIWFFVDVRKDKKQTKGGK